MTFLLYALSLLAVAGLILGARCLYNRHEKHKLESQWRSKGRTHNRRKWISGEVDEGFLRGFAVFGWMGYSHQ